MLIGVLGGMSAQNGTDNKVVNNYKHSVGLNIGWLDGLSMKFNVGENLYLQTDIGGSFHANPLCFIHDALGGPVIYTDLGVQLNVFYENRFPKRSNAYWIVGGGMSFGKDCTESIKSPNYKTGADVMLGIEWKFNIPLSIQLDTRQGYGVIFAPTKVANDNKDLLYSKNPWQFYDYSFVFSVRYCFGK